MVSNKKDSSDSESPEVCRKNSAELAGLNSGQHSSSSPLTPHSPLWSSNVDIYLLLSAKESAPISEKRCGHHDQKYYKDSHDTRTATSAVPLSAIFSPSRAMIVVV